MKKHIFHLLAFSILLLLFVLILSDSAASSTKQDKELIRKSMSQLGFQISRINKLSGSYIIVVNSFTTKTRALTRKGRSKRFSLTANVINGQIILDKTELEKAGFALNVRALPKGVKIDQVAPVRMLPKAPLRTTTAPKKADTAAAKGVTAKTKSKTQTTIKPKTIPPKTTKPVATKTKPKIQAIKKPKTTNPKITKRIPIVPKKDVSKKAKPAATIARSKTPPMMAKPGTTGSKPDLILTDISFSKANPTDVDRISITATIKNQGNSAALLRTRTLPLNAFTEGGVSFGESLRFAYNISINPNETKRMHINCGSKDVGTYRIFVRVDPENGVDESSESNNDSSIHTLTVSEGAKPDLVITDMQLDPPEVTTLTDYKLVVTVKNQGAADAVFRGSPYNDMILSGGIQVPGLGSGNGQTIPSNQTRVFRLTPRPVGAGTYTWTLRVDPMSKITETNEGNNDSSINITIEEPDETAAKPDLILTDISFAKANPTDVDRISITATIKNQGDGAALIRARTLPVNAFTEGGEPFGESFRFAYNIPINPNETKRMNINCGSKEAATYRIFVRVDPDNAVEESSESNNDSSIHALTVSVGAKPDLVITDMQLDPPEMTTQTDSKLLVTVKNQGAADAVFPGLPNQATILSGGVPLGAIGSGNGVTIPSNQTRVFRLTPRVGNAGTFNWTVRVDPDNRIKESNEGNNERSIQVTIRDN